MALERVAVVGGGLAGLSAALALKAAGTQVSLFERSRILGGRATSFEIDGIEVDNGQHVFLACCSDFIGFAQAVGMGDQLHLQDRFAATVLSSDGRIGQLRESSLPAPFHLALSFLSYPHLNLIEKLSIAQALLACLRQPERTACHPERSAAESKDESACHPERSAAKSKDESSCHPERSAAKSKDESSCHPERSAAESKDESACHPERSAAESKDESACHPERSAAKSKDESSCHPERSAAESKDETTRHPERSAAESKDESACHPERSAAKSKDESSCHPERSAAESKDESSCHPERSAAESKDESSCHPERSAAESKDESACHPERSAAESKDETTRHPERAQRVEGRSSDDTFETWLRDNGQGAGERAAFWDPFFIPALNAPFDRVAAADAMFVLRTAFLGEKDAARFGFSKVPLAHLAAAAANKLDNVYMSTPVLTVTPAGDAVTLTLPKETLDFDAVVLAVPPRQIERMLANPKQYGIENLNQYDPYPIVDVHLWHDGGTIGRDFAAALDSPLQWIFEKEPGYLACSISSAEKYLRETTAELEALAWREVQTYLPSLQNAKLTRKAVTRNPEATWLPRVGVKRTEQRTANPRIAIAGSWTDTGWPDTMESAVRSGKLAANVILSEAERRPSGVILSEAEQRPSGVILSEAERAQRVEAESKDEGRL